MPQELDLTPDPRVLQMLGEINLHQWRCMAELIDNGIDGFLNAARAGRAIENPEVSITVPTSDNENARVAVKDNGPGMSIDQLENAVKAGWTGNNPLTNLGLFGMGFNISTARLGLVTEVWTTRAGDPEYVGVRIDLDELRSTRSFRVPRQTRPKTDHNEHSTEIVISRLKPDQRAYLARANNIKTIRKHLARTYSSLLQGTEVGNLRLRLNGTRIDARRHCIWSEDRTVELSDGTVVRAVERIDVPLAPRRYCTHCMLMLPNDGSPCPTGSANCAVGETPRRIRGWIGLQRYLDETEYGIDFVRNGRKIEIGCKDLFVWSDGEVSEVEYPIDDPRNRGRFVGEIHIDHCRVSYTKDRFERDDPAWDEMMRIIRGDGPLQPMKAKQRGYGENRSALFKLFQAFRRSSPQGKNGLWSRIMVVKDNERARQMAEAFANNEVEHLTDERWWQLVEEQDREILGDTGTPPGGETTTTGGGDVPPGFLDPGASGGQPPKGDPTQPPSPEPRPTFRRPLHELTRKFSHPTYRVEYEIQGFAVESEDRDLPAGSPWLLKMEDVATRTYAFLVDVGHEVFRSTTMTPLDGLLTELAYRTMDFLKGQVQDVSLAAVLTEFRGEYCVESRLDPREIIALATSVLGDIARSISENLGVGKGEDLFAELTGQERDAITRRMASREVPDHKAVIASGRFLDYAEPQSIHAFFNRHPELFLDGVYWDDAFAKLDFGSTTVTVEARERVRSRYDAYLVDAVWLANQTPNDLEKADRDALVRATCSLRLLRPDIAT
jgi:hypothetical protein